MQEFLICLFSLEPRGCRDFLRPSPTVMLKASVEVQFKFRRVFQLSLAHPARSLGSSSRSQFAFEPLKFTDNGRIIFASEKDGRNHLYSIAATGGPPQLLLHQIHCQSLPFRSHRVQLLITVFQPTGMTSKAMQILATLESVGTVECGTYDGNVTIRPGFG